MESAKKDLSKVGEKEKEKRNANFEIFPLADSITTFFWAFPFLGSNLSPAAFLFVLAFGQPLVDYFSKKERNAHKRVIIPDHCWHDGRRTDSYLGSRDPPAVLCQQSLPGITIVLQRPSGGQEVISQERKGDYILLTTVPFLFIHIQELHQQKGKGRELVALEMS